MIGLLADLYRWATRPPHVYIPFQTHTRSHRCVCGHGRAFHPDGGWCHYCGCSYMQPSEAA